MTTDTQTYNPTKRLKALHRKSGNGDAPKAPFKDFASDLMTSGTSQEKKLVVDWLNRKAPEVGKPVAPAKLALEPPVKSHGKKR